MSAAAPRSVIIAGATSGMARACAAVFAREGYAVALGARNDEENERIANDLRVRYGGTAAAIHFEAADFDSHEGFLTACAEALGGEAGGLIYFAGTMAEQRAAEQDFTLARTMIDVNYTGCVSLTEAFARRCEARQAGFIGLVSSAAGDRGKQSNYIYGSTKGAMTVYAQGLRNRLFKSGVSVTTVKPGFVDTAMTFGMKLPPALTASPEQAAEAIFRGVVRRRDVVYVLWFWRYIMLIICAIPEWQFKKMGM
ncbi:MAG: SDR family oxidoreductase [Candidatus Hydrogenedens sp.]|nr:SDR family oxidoreductase [Candidatus Hydrogenedens sp.]